MFSRKRNAKENIQEELNNTQPQEEAKEELAECNNPKTIRKVINGKLYDTSKATHICNLCMWHEKIPDYKFCFCSLGGENVSIYKGNAEWFIKVHEDIIFNLGFCVKHSYKYMGYENELQRTKQAFNSYLLLV